MKKHPIHMVASLLLTLCCAGGVQAQEVEPDEASEAIESEANQDELERVRHQAAPDGSENYEEIHQMRVLERIFMPESSNLGEAQSPEFAPMHNPLELSGRSAIELLSRSANQGEISRGLQRRASRLLEDAVAQVRTQLEKSGSLTQPFGVDCAWQPAVQKHIALFTSGSAGTMKTWLKRLERWRHVLEKVLVEEQVPTDLIYLAMIESGFKPRVKSPASAAGMWQFMAGTGIEMGLKIDEWVDERYDPIKAAHAAAQYLKKQFNRYHSWPLAMAAYNGGPGTVNIAIDRYNTNDYFKLVQYGAMYDETRRYVPRIMAAAIIGHHPEAFGFDGLKPEPLFEFDSVEVPGGIPLSVLAKAAECSVDDLRELNPELLRDQVPPGGNYELRIPVNRHQKFTENFDEVQKKYAKTESMTLRFGENFDTLAEDLHVAARVLRTLNGFGTKENADYGASIFVPSGSQRHPDKASEPPLALISPETFDLDGKKRVFYQTQSGDSIREIAQAFGLLPTQIAVWNELDIFAKLRPKMFLQIFVDQDADLSAIRTFEESDLRIVVRGSSEHQALEEARKNANKKSAKSASSKASKNDKKSNKKTSEYVIHVVAKGDTLEKIAKKYGVTIESIQKLNGLKSKSTIRKGQKLKIKKQ